MPATDLLNGYADAPTAPARRLLSITPNDNNDLPFVTKWLWVGVVGNVNIQAVGDVGPVLLTVPAGTWLPIRAARVLATGTTAGNIVGGY